MPRRKQFDRGEAIHAAMQEIWRNGSEAASVLHLSKILGITRSSFYNAFVSRDELYREALGEYRNLMPQIPQLGPQGEPVLPRLTAFVRAICRFNMKSQWRGCLFANSIAEMCPNDSGLGKELAKMMRDAVRQVKILLDRAKAQGEISQRSDTQILALALENLLLGLNVFGKAVRDEKAVWRVAETTLRGLGLYAAAPKRLKLDG